MADEMRRFIVFDRWGAYVRDMERVVSAEHTEQLNGADTLVIKTTEELARGQRIVWRDHTGAWHEHEVGEIVEARDGAGEPLITATCRSSICELDGDYLVDVQPSGSAWLILSRALSESRWTVGTVDVAGSDAMVFYHMSAYAAVQKVVERFGGEVRADIAVTPSTGVTGRSVSLLAHRGQTTATRRFDYGRDVQGIKRTVDESAIITALYAWGKGEELDSGGYGRRIGIAGVTSDHLPYVHDDAANEVWGRGDGGYVFGELVLQDVTDPHVLLDRANKYLAEHCEPLVSYSATVEQFGAAGLDLTGVSLGDDVQVVDSYHERELRLTARVVKLKRDLLNDRVIDVTLGNVLPTSATSKTKLEGAVSRLIDNEAVTDAMQAASAVYVERVIDRLNDMFDVGGGYVEMDVTKGLTFTNGPDFASSTMALNLSGAGFRIANSKTAGGDWNWRTFGTGAGFVADEIVSGVLKAGTITDVTGLNYWNLDTGDLRMGAGATIDGVAASDVLASIDDAQNAANDDNLIPFTGRMDYLYGWAKGPGWLSGKENSYIEAYSDTLDWNHRIVSPEIPLADLWGRELTFAVDGKSASADATVHIDVSIYHAGQSSRWAWFTPGDFTFGSGSYSRPSKTFTIGPDTAWSYPSGSTDRTFVTGTDKARVVLSLRTLNQRVNLNRWMLQPGGTATAWRPSAMDAASSVDDENLLPYTENVDEAHGWSPRNATLNGVTGMTIAANTSGTLDWSHAVYAPMIPLSVIWRKQVTFSGFFKSTVENTSVLVYVELWRPGASARHAWRQIGTINPSTTSMTRYSCTIIPDADTQWSYTSQSDTTIDWQKDKARFFVAVRTLNATVTSNRWKLQYGYHTTDWMPSSSDASATTALNTLTQEDVFNRLTNNGQVQGIYLQNGKVYINASYIKTGTLSADLVRTGKLLSANGQSYFDLTNNIIRLGTSSNVGTTIESSGQIKAADANGSYFGTVAAGNAGSGVVGQMIYLAHGNYIFGALRAIPAGTSGTSYCGVELYTLKYSKRVTVSAFYALTAAQKVALFNTDANIGSSFGLSSESISAGSTEGNWSFLVNKNGVYFKGTPIS